MMIEGNAWEWDVELYGGPLDGLRDIAFSLEEEPPKILAKCQDIDKKRGEKFAEDIFKTIPNDKRTWVYELCSHTEEIYKYKYLETIYFKDFKEKYAYNAKSGS